MKKTYINPAARVRPLSVDVNFLASQESGATGQNVTILGEGDFDTFFN